MKNLIAKINPVPKMKSLKEKTNHNVAKVWLLLTISFMSQSASANAPLTSARNFMKDLMETFGYAVYLIFGAAFVWGALTVVSAFGEFKNMKDLKQRGHNPMDTWIKLGAGVALCCIGAILAWLTASAGESSTTIGPNTNVIDMNNFKIK